MRSKALASSLLIAGIAGSNPAEGTGLVSLLCVRVSISLCDELMTRSEEFYRVCVFVCLIVCDLETLTMILLGPAFGCSTTKKKCLKLDCK